MRVSASARLLPLPRIHLVPIIILDLPMPQKTHRAERTNSVQPDQRRQPSVDRCVNHHSSRSYSIGAMAAL
jgi:hypothetical protein